MKDREGYMGVPNGLDARDGDRTGAGVLYGCFKECVM